MLHARSPRDECQEHGIKQALLPWAEKNSSFALLVERFAIDVLQAKQAVSGAEGILGTTWDETWHILRRGVACGRARKSAEPMPRIGIDETAFRKGQNYITLLYGRDRGTIEAMSVGNATQSGNPFFGAFQAAD
jgi:transposase